MLDLLTSYCATEIEATVSGAATRADAHQYQKATSTHRLVLNTFRGWDGDLIGAARAFKDVHVSRISVFGSPAVDISSLNAFAELTELQVAGLVIGNLDLDCFPSLEKFGLGAELNGPSKITLNWGKCQNLLRIGGLGKKMPPIKVLATFPNLRALSIVKPDWEPEELQSLKTLVSLDMSGKAGEGFCVIRCRYGIQKYWIRGRSAIHPKTNQTGSR